MKNANFERQDIIYSGDKPWLDQTKCDRRTDKFSRGHNCKGFYDYK